ncbi:OLC1v1027440C1 [Oldenlandia corymbosa var. corymbosa]|uniref:OLC1v1027440C1 n=1 Tax=Oldenlandia corymbosa var. corymbosa TaxID=529605 RepID=A0AAV1CCI1_OLDCO|nr:OLC1v1027440C1 [Oldenlandia corymbosa var. corymbosa]
MASSAADSNLRTLHLCPSPRVRIVGRIRSFTERESEALNQDSKPWITVRHNEDGASSDSGVILSCTDQSSSRKDGPYKLDYCYEQHQGNDTIFSREIKPLISDVLNGRNASVIAYGAKGSGKTYTIQGTQDKPGIAALSMAELLSKSQEAGDVVSVSILEVHQEHAFDLLDPKHSEVQVLGDGRGKINLKGLTQVPVKSVPDFENLYISKLNISKPVQKMPLEPPKRSHKCLMMHVSKVDDNSNKKLVGKMLFIDLAGYEDGRRSSREGVAFQEATKTNRSLQALMNVVYALNTNESHVPYRESKLTRIFQESLDGINHVVMLTCLNPHFCPDTLHVLGLASRSCQSTNHLLSSFTKSTKSSSRQELFLSQRKMKPSTTPNTLKKRAVSTVHASTKKASMSKGRQLLDGAKKVYSNQPEQDGDYSVKKLDFETDDPKALALVPLIKDSQDDKSTFDHDLNSVPEGEVSSTDKLVSDSSSYVEPKEDACVADHPLTALPLELVPHENSISGYPSEMKFKENDASVNNVKNSLDVDPQCISMNSPLEDGKEKKHIDTNAGGSPTLTARLQEMSYLFKSFCTSTPLSVRVPEDSCAQLSVQAGYPSDLIEPKTPTIEHGANLGQRLEATKFTTPLNRLYTRSSGMKDSLVQEYLKFLNTADKEELKELKGIGEKRATYILKLREQSPEPFKNLDDLQDIGLSAKQVKGMMKKMAGEFFS